MFCSFSSAFFLVGDRVYGGSLKDEITPSLKANESLKFAQDVPLNHVRDKGKP